jgi:hypothetical protein
MVVMRDKISMHPVFHVVIWTAIVAMIALILATAGPTVAAILPVLAGLAALSMTATLRTTVTQENVHIQYGFIGPTIPTASITSVKAVDYSWWKYGGWGIRYSLLDQSWCYNMIGDGGKAVEIQYKKNGKQKKILVASKQNALLADAILQAKIQAESGVTLDFNTPENTESKVDARQEISG